MVVLPVALAVALVDAFGVALVDALAVAPTVALVNALAVVVTIAVVLVVIFLLAVVFLVLPSTFWFVYCTRGRAWQSSCLPSSFLAVASSRLPLAGLPLCRFLLVMLGILQEKRLVVERDFPWRCWVGRRGVGKGRFCGSS